ncbi:type II secretion system secretin GspD [Anderseniella sp. Alg231-50]|uniref:type II secretion system secretin GspD n=1 Tax=Anderseniella sp. Alg231-50 TaxID=1922226 RepID=UPI00307C4819
MKFAFSSIVPVFLVGILLILQGCSNSTLVDEPDDNFFSKHLPLSTASTGSADNNAATLAIEQPRDDDASTFRGVTQRGTDNFLALPGRSKPRAADRSSQGERITFNLVDAPIEQAARAVLGDILGANYAIEGYISGTITWRTTRPLTKAEVLSGFETALQANGATMIERHGMLRILPIQAAANIPRTLDTNLSTSSAVGDRNYFLQLKYVSASELREVLEPIVPPGSILRVDQARNALILQGSPNQIAAVRESAELFDVDWLKGMSFALRPLKNSNPVAVARELDTIFATKSGPLKGVLRFVPNVRLKAVLVISSRAAYLPKAENWIAKLDAKPDAERVGVHVYNVQNRDADELARILRSVYRSKSGRKIQVETGVAPRESISRGVSQGVVSSRGDEDSSEEPRRVAAFADEGSFNNSGEDDDVPPEEVVRVVSDDANNSLLVVATDEEYDRILKVLKSVDTRPNQVLLEAVIAEVVLNDELQFGVRWYLGRQNNNATFSDSLTGAVSSVFPGFSYFLAIDNVEVALNALNGVTDVNVVSSPSLMVLDNRKATLQVGDQVPIVVQQSTSVEAADAPVVNAIEQKDTGVILSITPRVNDSGRVILDIEQEVSTVVPTTTSGIDSPTIRRRKIETTVVVQDGQTLTLGGLIQETEDQTDEKVPLLGDIPYLGTAFRSRDTLKSKTELVIFVRPRVIRDTTEAFEITNEFRKRLVGFDKGKTKPGSAESLKKTFNRIVN